MKRNNFKSLLRDMLSLLSGRSGRGWVVFGSGGVKWSDASMGETHGPGIQILRFTGIHVVPFTLSRAKVRNKDEEGWVQNEGHKTL